jgi:hypothetical protein
MYIFYTACEKYIRIQPGQKPAWLPEDKQNSAEIPGIEIAIQLSV